MKIYLQAGTVNVIGKTIYGIKIALNKSGKSEGRLLVGKSELYGIAHKIAAASIYIGIGNGRDVLVGIFCHVHFSIWRYLKCRKSLNGIGILRNDLFGS